MRPKDVREENETEKTVRGDLRQLRDQNRCFHSDPVYLLRSWNKLNSDGKTEDAAEVCTCCGETHLPEPQDVLEAELPLESDQQPAETEIQITWILRLCKANAALESEGRSTGATSCQHLISWPLTKTNRKSELSRTWRFLGNTDQKFLHHFKVQFSQESREITEGTITCDVFCVLLNMTGWSSEFKIRTLCLFVLQYRDSDTNHTFYSVKLNMSSLRWANCHWAADWDIHTSV